MAHRREQQTAFERQSTPATHVAPRSKHSARPSRAASPQAT
ncbi:hypothetical protein [Streptomyces tsukubensis]